MKGMSVMSRDIRRAREGDQLLKSAEGEKYEQNNTTM